jgi:group II intron reverse transcriptase/maturase
MAGLKRSVKRSVPIFGPYGEAKLTPHTYGFRPGRSCWDAIEAIFQRIVFRPQYALKVDIAKCFDRICHTALLAKTQASPGIRRHIKAWLKAGIMEDGQLLPSTAGTPQGGTISPLLALIALHGMDNAITDVYPQARVITYADDCVVLHEDRQVLEHCQQLLMTWLAAIGLTLNEAKSHIQHTLEDDQPGFDFLGFHIRQYRVGKHRSGRHASGHRLGFKTLIKPAKANIQAHLAELGRIIQRSKALPQSTLIRQLNPGIRGWASYYRTCVSQAVYGRLDHLLWEKLRRWAYRRHPMQSVAWAIKRYWHRRETRLAFATPRRTRTPWLSARIVRWPLHGTSKSGTIAVPMMATGCIGARDADGIRVSVHAWPHCLNGSTGAVRLVGCASTMTTALRLITSMGIDVMRARVISKRSMDTAMMRKRGSSKNISREVSVTSIRILRSGVMRKYHAPFWNSGRRSDPPIDCNKLAHPYVIHAATRLRDATTAQAPAPLRSDKPRYVNFSPIDFLRVTRFTPFFET